MNFVLEHFDYQLELEHDECRLAIREHIAFVKPSCSSKVDLSKLENLIVSEEGVLSVRVMFHFRLV